MTSAAKLSPLRMSCGFSSEYASKSGSTMLKPGSVPAVRVGEELLGAPQVPNSPAIPSG